ncbi:hypothetical protein [Anaerosinus massiliensis]|uniref:hypothetical protein n=1 Tax=Massilibacillus massiliensis TaxID=1806837 RepID=UPI001F41FA9F|nr:hypothetical protein [Massilibacillus massiliensis]
MVFVAFSESAAIFQFFCEGIVEVIAIADLIAVSVGVRFDSAFCVVEEGVAFAYLIGDGFEFVDEVVFIADGIAFAVGGFGEVAGVVVGVEFSGTVGFEDFSDSTPFIEFIFCFILIAVYDSCDISLGIIFVALPSTSGGLEVLGTLRDATFFRHVS